MDRLGVDKAIRAWQLQGQAGKHGKTYGKTCWDFIGFHGEQWEID